MPNYNLPSFSQGFYNAREGARNAQMQDIQLRALQDAEQDALWQREAAAYLAPIAQHRTAAISSGMPMGDYFAAQMAALRNDPGFQQKSPDVQERILNMMADTATVEAQRAARRHDYDTSNAILRAIGQSPDISERERLMQQDDPWAIIRSLQQQGVPVSLSEDNQFAVGPDGSKVPVAQFVSKMMQSQGSPVAGFEAASLWSAEEAERKRQEDQANRVYDQLVANMQPQATAGQVIPETGPPLLPPSTEQPVQATNWGALGNEGMAFVRRFLDVLQSNRAQPPISGAGLQPAPVKPTDIPLAPAEPQLSAREQELQAIRAIDSIAQLQQEARGPLAAMLRDRSRGARDFVAGGQGRVQRYTPSATAQFAQNTLQAYLDQFNALNTAEIQTQEQVYDRQLKELQGLQWQLNNPDHLNTLSSQGVRDLTSQAAQAANALNETIRTLEDLRRRKLY